jgi:SAM-dependent methyltransferase
MPSANVISAAIRDLVVRGLAVPEAAGVDVDDPNRLAAHAAVLARKPMLAAVFKECHELMLDLDRRTFGDTPGLRVELGAGVAPISGTFPEVLATDVVPGPGLDRVLDAQRMDLPDGAVRALYGQNCFHHFPDPVAFLTESERVLAPGGGVVLIEPYYGPVASVVFKRLFASETFDMRMPGWTSHATGPMQGANQALSYIVFVRDRARFERELPNLELVDTFPLASFLRYLLSGGLNFRQLTPTLAGPALRALEAALAPARRIVALHHVVVLRRRASSEPGAHRLHV